MALKKALTSLAAVLAAAGVPVVLAAPPVPMDGVPVPTMSSSSSSYEEPLVVIDASNIETSSNDVETLAEGGVCKGYLGFVLNKAICCEGGLLGLHTGCSMPYPIPESSTDFVSGCEQEGKTAFCCAIGLVCILPPPSLSFCFVVSPS